ncbi:MAG: transporter [Methylomicrobium sp.]
MKIKLGHCEFLLCRAIKGGIFISCLFFMSESYAITGKKNNDLAEYKKLIAEQQKQFERQQQIIAEQGKQLEQLKQRLDVLTNQSAQTNQAMAKTAGNNGTATQAPDEHQIVSAKNEATASSAPAQMPSKPVGQPPPEAKKRRPPEIPRLTQTVGGVLTRKNNLVFEPSMLYSYYDNNRVFLDAYTFLPAIAVGLIDIRQIKQHTLMANLGLRYGLMDRLELEARIPYVYRTQEQRARPINLAPSFADQAFDSTGNDIGDIQIAGRYQLNTGSDGWPIVVANLLATAPTGKSPFDLPVVQATGIPGFSFPAELPTGVGFFSIQPSLTALYPTDPAVFFGNISYYYNAETSINAGKFDPGDAIGLSFGLGFGINERSSFSLGYQHRHIFDSTLNGKSITGSTVDIGQLLVGYSYKYSKRTTHNLTLSIGATTDSPDLTLEYRMPLNFDLN